jgi:hypothetical protein
MCAPIPPKSQRPSNPFLHIANLVAGKVAAVALIFLVFAWVPSLSRYVTDYRKRMTQLSHAATPIFQSSSGADRGREILPRLVTTLIDGLARENLTRFWATPSLVKGADWQLWQRMVEGPWPRRASPAATATLVPVSEPSRPTCREAPAGSGYKLIICP